MAELLPCPFCGGDAKLGENFGRMAVNCTWCEASLRSNEVCGDGSDVVERWNTRNDEAARQEERDRCADYIQLQAQAYRTGTPLGDKLYKLAKSIRDMEDDKKC